MAPTFSPLSVKFFSHAFYPSSSSGRGVLWQGLTVHTASKTKSISTLALNINVP